MTAAGARASPKGAGGTALAIVHGPILPSAVAARRRDGADGAIGSDLPSHVTSPRALGRASHPSQVDS
jgi:hypothetical protein